MIGRFKLKDKQELFKLLQQAFFVEPEKNCSYELSQDGERLQCIFTIAANYDWNTVSKSLRRKLGKVLPEGSDRTVLGRVTLSMTPKSGVLELKSGDIKFECEKRFDIFNQADTEILSILAKRCLNYKTLSAKAAEVLGVKAEGLKLRLIPENVLALRVFVNSSNIYLGDIDVSELDDLTYAFSIYSGNKVQENKRTNFDGIETWNTSKVKKMLGVFAGCVNFNKDISMWDTSAVETMDVMFASCRKFNQPLGSWNTSKVQSLKGMFYRCDSFDQDLSGWDTGRVKDMSYTFFKSKGFKHDISKWSTDSVKTDENMFLECPLNSDFKPDLPSENFKRQYYERYVGPNAKKIARQDAFKKVGIAAAFIIIIVVFSIVSHQL